ncbi:F-box protein SKIP23 [Carex littledalei]|uniref:F-box protein SKIP23 n=1 Tax=Carex littledalei TaxID=544730 RepID=A0A833R2J9_9POAL|nr:F-box protein SKIP23 [Carex littledalei]
MEDTASAFPDCDWAHLPLAAVHLISKKVKSITDYVRFCAVCSPWRSASLPKPHHLPPQLPWLMIPYMVHIPTVDDGIRLFYDLWEAKMRKIPLPETIGKMCCATYRGWLLIAASDGSELFLLNPLTRARVPLPPFNIPVKHIWDGDEEDKRRWGDRERPPPRMVDHLFTAYAITKITFSTDLTDPNCVIMAFFERARGIFYCKVGDPSWTQVAQPPYPNAELADAAYNNGSFYLYYEGVMAIYNLNQHKVQGMYFFKPELKSLPKFFVVGKSGVFMVVVHPTREEHRRGEEAEGVTGKAPKQKIDLYQVIDEEPRMDVKRVADTSDTAIFYGDKYHYMAVSTDDWDSLDGNCIYMEYVCSSSVNNEVMLNLMAHEHWKDHKPCYGIFFSKLDDGNPEPEPVVLGIADMPMIIRPPPSMWFQPSFV